MKNLNLKKWTLALAIAGSSVTGYAGSVREPASQPNQPGEQKSVTTIERETYRTTNTQRSNPSTPTTREETVEFESNSLALTDASEDKLENLVENLDKAKPVAVIVDVEESTASLRSSYNSTNSTASNPTTSSSEPGMADSSAGFPGDQSTASSSATSADPQREARERNAQALSQYRAESVRQFLEEKGLDVVEWSVEGLEHQHSISVNKDSRPAQDVQTIRIVINGQEDREGLSAL